MYKGYVTRISGHTPLILPVSVMKQAKSNGPRRDIQ